jgi:hypothetical protein
MVNLSRRSALVLALVPAVACVASSDVALAYCYPTDKPGSCPQATRPAGPDTGGPGRQAPPSGKIPNGAPTGPGSGPKPVKS